VFDSLPLELKLLSVKMNSAVTVIEALALPSSSPPKRTLMPTRITLVENL
jgi:hypothetical protein